MRSAYQRRLLLVSTGVALMWSLQCQAEAPPWPGPEGGAKPIQAQGHALTVGVSTDTSAAVGGSGGVGGVGGAGGLGGSAGAGG